MASAKLPSAAAKTQAPNGAGGEGEGEGEGRAVKVDHTAGLVRLHRDQYPDTHDYWVKLGRCRGRA